MSSPSAPPLPSAPGACALPAEVPGDTLAALINLAGRQRMLSQHLVLHAVLASRGNEQALHCAKGALALFADTHTTLVQGKGRLPGAHFAEVRAAYFGAPAGDERIREFIGRAQETLLALQNAEAQAASLLPTLITSAGALLPLLNQITQIYEAESRRCAHSLQRQLLALADGIASVARQAGVAAYNAQVLAARSGEAGRDFAAVARELAQVAGHIEQLGQVALRVPANRVSP